MRTKGISNKQFKVVYLIRDIVAKDHWKLNFETRTFSNEQEAEEFTQKVLAGTMNTDNRAYRSAKVIPA